MIYDDGVYSEAKALRYADQGSCSEGLSIFWSGNFFSDMRSWDKFEAQKFRGAGSRMVGIRFPGSPMWAHMPMVPPQTYKKAHRHGPGVVIVVPAGEGYSIMWEEGKEKVMSRGTRGASSSVGSINTSMRVPRQQGTWPFMPQNR